jgi:hypothetical protein
MVFDVTIYGNFSNDARMNTSTNLSWMIEFWMKFMSLIETKLGVFCILTFL